MAQKEKNPCRGGQRGAHLAGSALRQAADCTTPEPPGRTGTVAARYSGHERRRSAP